MIASEVAFLSLGLLLGVAGGAVLVMILGGRQPSREVRLTVGHDAIPRRASTLSSDAFVTSQGEPARGGPADRRMLDREHLVDTTGAAVMDTRPMLGFEIGTPVPSAVTSFAPLGGSGMPERDPQVDAIRVRAAIEAERMYRADLPTAAALLDARAEAPAVAVAEAPAMPNAEAAMLDIAAREPVDSVEVSADPADPIDQTPALTRILRGDHRALFATVSVLAGADAAERRPWQAAVLSVTQAIMARTIASGWLDVPVGNPFWDTFTLEQCRQIAGGLAATGHRFDGVDGWEDERVPNYRDLTNAVANAGIEPRRIRAWPTQREIADLYREVTAAPDEYLATYAPNLDLAEMHALVGIGGPERARLWENWDRVVTVFRESTFAT